MSQALRARIASVYILAFFSFPNVVRTLAAQVDFMPVYSTHLRDIIKKGIDHPENYEQPLKGFKIIVDAGNGSGGFLASDVLAPLGADTSGVQHAPHLVSWQTRARDESQGYQGSERCITHVLAGRVWISSSSLHAGPAAPLAVLLTLPDRLKSILQPWVMLEWVYPPLRHTAFEIVKQGDNRLCRIVIQKGGALQAASFWIQMAGSQTMCPTR